MYFIVQDSIVTLLNKNTYPSKSFTVCISSLSNQSNNHRLLCLVHAWESPLIVGIFCFRNICQSGNYESVS